MPVAFVDYSSGSAVTYYLHVDQVMNPQRLTDASGAVVWDRVQDPFGVEISATGSLTQGLRFPGQYADDETSLFQNWNRDYDPSLGRYIQSDPIGLMGGINTYAYVAGNPLIAADPDGLTVALAFRAAAIGGTLAGRWAAPHIAKALIRAGIVALPVAALHGDQVLRETPVPPQCPDDADCEEEWKEAIKRCARRIGDPNWRGITGGFGNLYDCARGQVSERCGGNPVKH